MKENKWPLSAKITVWVLWVAFCAVFAGTGKTVHRNIKLEQITDELANANVGLKKENDICNLGIEVQLNLTDPPFPTEEYFRQQEILSRKLSLANTYRRIWVEKYPVKMN
ncbi:hypothetical protein QET93_003625 [Akkermansia sp. N21116]|jgi:hypothetical protein|uniref:hypothetical protein n=1 Tax=Akkermansia sp. N21116 TaxID=3040764 RepID=UPI00244EDA99|nr:hypothetical protein [Akkermansia sp. N21116]WPX41193.1 hypothetical protein QET93_003625 [Akkermansia sp. N21116]